MKSDTSEKSSVLVKEETKVGIKFKFEPENLVQQCSVVLVKVEHSDLKPGNGGPSAPDQSAQILNHSDEHAKESGILGSADLKNIRGHPVWSSLCPLPEVRIYLWRCDDDGFGSQDLWTVKPKVDFKLERKSSGHSKAADETKRGRVKRLQCPFCLKLLCNLIRHVKMEHTGGRFTCRFCTKTYKSIGATKGHEQREHPDEIGGKHSGIRCESCGKTLKNKDSLLAHKAVYTTGKREFPCKFCPIRYSCSFNLRIHEVQKHAAKVRRGNLSKTWKCKFCSATFSDEGDMNRHQVIVHVGKQKYFCGFCPRRFQELRSKRVHENLCHEKDLNPKDLLHKHKCEVCEKVFYKKYSLNYHTKIHAGMKDVPCSFCPAMFRSNGDKKSHELHRHSDKFPGGREALKVHKCDQCSVGFITKSGLRQHMTVHMKERKFKCSLCGNSFKKKMYMKLHERQCHSDDKESLKKHACNWCGKKFMTKAEVKGHERTHTGHKPFKCQSCNKRYGTSTGLNIHVQRRHVSNPEEKEALLKHRCSLCPKKFFTRAGLETHSRSHSDERAYECRFCPKKFKGFWVARLHEVKKHVQNADEINAVLKYGCKFCSQRYPTPSELVDHERIHTGERPFSCRICSKSFTSRHILRGHEKIHIDAENRQD